MPTPLDNVQTATDLGGQTGQAAQSALDGTKALSVPIPGEEPGVIPMNGASESPGMGILGGLGMLSGGLTVGKGIGEIQDGKTGQGAYDVLSGGASFGQGAAAALTPLAAEGGQLASALGPAGGALGVFGGGLQMGKGIAEATNGQGADATMDLMQGGLNTTAGAATMLGAAPVAAVAGAGALGMSVGKVMGDAADSDLTKTGVWGTDADTGKNKSAMDWGAGWGTWVDSHTGDKNPANPSVLGGIAAGAGGIVGGIAGAGQALYNWL